MPEYAAPFRSFMRKLRYILLFYSSLYPATLSISLIGIAIVGLYGLGALQPVLWFKAIAYGIVVYHVDQSRRREFWYFYNLGFTRRGLWMSVTLLDFCLFFTLLWIWLHYG